MKGLKSTLIIAKIFQIIFKICYICFIVGASLCFVSLLCILFLGNNSEITNLFVKIETTKDYAIFYMIAYIIIFSAYIYPVYKTYKMLETVEINKQPFSYEIVKDMQKMGIIYMALEIGITIITDIVASIMNIKEYEIKISSFSIGIIFLLISFLVEYGASVINSKNLDDKKELL